MSRGSPTGNAFVFVVCGSREYIDQLHYSLRAIQSVSGSRIVVVTDSARNEQRIDWDDIVDVAAPGELDHHQASIHLKTGLHRLLPPGPCYCYLDADIVALRPEVDDVFQHKSGPVTFAADHCMLSEFSPYTLHCGCLERHMSDLSELESMLADLAVRSLQPTPSPEPRPQAEVERATSRIERILARIPFRRAAANPQPEEPEPEHRQVDGEVGEVPERYSRWTHDPVSQRWTSPEGHEVHTVRCNHLVERVRQKFGISVRDPNWQHWNGGVFVFDSLAHEFLDAWHRKTMAIFKDSAWRTRDQRTLAATVWEFGLQDARVLCKGFNFIVDYFRKGRVFIAADGLQITNDTFATSITPALVHVLNHFGDKTWDIWEWVDRQVENHAAAGMNTSVSALECPEGQVDPGPEAS